jgi:hypothetical protein
MLRDHGAVVHLVDVVAGQDEHVFRIVVADDVQVLEHGIGGAGVPGGLGHALLRRPQLHELAELAAQEAPALLDVQDQRVGLVLGQHADAAMPELMQLDSGKSTIRNLPPKGTAGFDRHWVRLRRREPRPPAGSERQGVAGQTTDETRAGIRHTSDLLRSLALSLSPPGRRGGGWVLLSGLK